MIPANLLNNTETQIIVSYGIMQGGGINPMGHAYLLFSYYCPNSQRMIVDDAIGFYSTPLPEKNTWRRKISALSFFDEGHLLQESYRYLVPNGTSKAMQHYHKSWQISSQQYQDIIEKINKDRGEAAPLQNRDFSTEHTAHENFKQKSSPEKKAALAELKITEDKAHLSAKGPRFDVIQHSCKTDALKRLAAIGINTTGIHNRLIDLPVSSGKISAHRLGFDSELNKLIWQSPLALSPQQNFKQETRVMQDKILAQRKYQLLTEHIKSSMDLFALKINDLSDTLKKNSPKAILKTHYTQLADLLENMNKTALNPREIHAEKIEAYFEQYRRIINGTKTDLVPYQHTHQLQGFLQALLDNFIHLCTTFGALVCKPNVIAYSEGYLIKKVEAKIAELAPSLTAPPIPQNNDDQSYPDRMRTQSV